MGLFCVTFRHISMKSCWVVSRLALFAQIVTHCTLPGMYPMSEFIRSMLGKCVSVCLSPVFMMLNGIPVRAH